MGITSISNLNPLPPARLGEGKLEPLPMERVESASRSGDETYSPSGGGTGSGLKDDIAEEDVEADGEAEEVDSDEPALAVKAEDSGAISFFA